VDEAPEFYCPKGLRMRADNVKQGSSEKMYATLAAGANAETCLIEYQYLLDMGVAPEEARMVLPQNTMTEWIWSGTLGAWLDMLKLRLDPHTQQETREVAQMIAVDVHKHFPISYAARIK
jgi:thymidylate synthase (FAD)